MDQGEGVEGAQRKRDPVDFALWKGQKPDEDTAWNSPWGQGRPGWHIECSAMAEAELGLGFEIHGGGSDLVFPHHENEAAQTCAARGAPLAQMWVHNGMVRLQEEKMAKSVGNISYLHEALASYGRDALIMYFCGGHYRQPLEFEPDRLAEASSRVERVREADPEGAEEGVEVGQVAVRGVVVLQDLAEQRLDQGDLDQGRADQAIAQEEFVRVGQVRQLQIISGKRVPEVSDRHKAAFDDVIQ